MVARPSAGLYSPLQGSMDDGPQSGSEGSDLHSPGFASYPPNDNYHHLIPQHTQFDYLPPVVGQQPPLIDAALEIPSPTSDEYSSGPFASSSRSHNHTQLHSSYIPSPVSPRLPNADYRYHSNSQSSERRLLSHDTNYHRPLPSVSINQDSRRVSGPLPASESPTASPTTTTSSHPPRREVSSVVIACRQCRGRKIRCDSTRPVCNNCVRRSNVCEYDSVPKRRGPDKKPGTRQRSCKKRPSEESDPVEVPPAKRKRSERRDAPVTEKVERVDDKVDPHRRYSNSSAGVYPQQHPHSSHSYSYSKTPSMLPVNHPKFPPPVSVDAEQRVWWDEFLQSYRLQDIRQELNTLFASAPQHLSFINIPFVLNKLADEPLNVQPSFVLAGLAMGLLMRSAAPSGSDTASDSLRRAMYLRNLAQSALEASYDSRWIDGTLAEAALILTLFEMSLHPEYSIQRIEKALLLLDDIIRHLALTSLDASDPEVTRFSQRSAPVVHLQSSSLSPVSPLAACVCTPADSLRPPDPYSTSVYQLPWDENWTEYEVRQEECRRLCWSALGMAAQYSIQCAVEERETVTSRMFICDPGNYAILFPGECIDRISPPYRAADAPSPKDSVWALYCRSMLLWSFCDNLKRRSYHQSGSAPQFEDKAEDAQEAWNEAQAIQDALEAHQCNLDTAVMWMCTEFIYNSRMAITQTFRRSVLAPDSVPTRPAFTPEQAEEWISFQGEIIKRASLSIRQYGVTGNPLARRPYQAPWFATQLQLCLRLWDSDPNLYSALRLGQEIMFLLNSINQLWPCRAHQLHCEELRKRLQAAQSFASAGSSDGHLRRSIKF